MGLAKLVQLFAEGVELPLTHGNQTILVWVAKLNSFQEGQVNHSARIARARAMLAIREIGNAEHDLFQASAEASTTGAIVESIVDSHSGELFMNLVRDVRSEEEWRERIEILEHSENVTDPAEQELIVKTERDYNRELLNRHELAQADLRVELGGLSRATLMERHEEAYIERRGFEVFSAERSRGTIYYSMRSCEGVKEGTGWNHDGCDHTRLFLASQAEVEMLPVAAQEQVVQAYEATTLSPQLARFTGALASSSESSEPSGTAEVSAPSGPAETPSEPGPISS